MTIQKVIRIILSPLVFILTFCGMIIIPVSVAAFVLGVIELTSICLKDPDTRDPYETKDLLIFTLTGVIFPYLNAQQFIKDGSFIK